MSRYTKLVLFVLVMLILSQVACSCLSDRDRQIVQDAETGARELKDGVDKAADKVKTNIDDVSKPIDQACRDNGNCK